MPSNQLERKQIQRKPITYLPFGSTLAEEVAELRADTWTTVDRRIEPGEGNRPRIDVDCGDAGRAVATEKALDAGAAAEVEKPAAGPPRDMARQQQARRPRAHDEVRRTVEPVQIGRDEEVVDGIQPDERADSAVAAGGQAGAFELGKRAGW